DNTLQCQRISMSADLDNVLSCIRMRLPEQCHDDFINLGIPVKPHSNDGSAMFQDGIGGSRSEEAVRNDRRFHTRYADDTNATTTDWRRDRNYRFVAGNDFVQPFLHGVNLREPLSVCFER